jgi:hypothetical protein
LIITTHRFLFLFPPLHYGHDFWTMVSKSQWHLPCHLMTDTGPSFMFIFRIPEQLVLYDFRNLVKHGVTVTVHPKHILCEAGVSKASVLMQLSSVCLQNESCLKNLLFNIHSEGLQVTRNWFAQHKYFLFWNVTISNKVMFDGQTTLSEGEWLVNWNILLA